MTVTLPNGSGPPVTLGPGERSIDLAAVQQLDMVQVFEKYDLVYASDTHLVVTDRSSSFREPPPGLLGELGSTGYTSYGSFARDEYLPRLRDKQGLQVYDQMRRSDAQVRSTLRLLKGPVLGTRWYVQPASKSARDKNAASLVWRNLTKFMSISFSQFLAESLLCLDFGYMLFEKVFTTKLVDGEPRWVWKKLAPRHPTDVEYIDYDDEGGPRAVKFYDTLAKPTRPVPIDKMLIFTFDREVGNVQGTSVLRSAYKHWYFKDNLYKIDAIQKERHGIGIPLIHLPAGFTSTGANNDLDKANEIGRNLRTNEKSHVVLPPMWELGFAKIEGQPTDCIPSIEHHNRQIAANIIGQWIEATNEGATATVAEAFLQAARFVADLVRDTMNKYAIPQLVDFNYSQIESNGEYPELRIRRIGSTKEIRELTFAVRNLTGASAMRPDDPLEDWFREEMDMPERDTTTDRVQEQRDYEEEKADRAAERAAAQPQPGRSPAQPGQPGNAKSAKNNRPPQSRAARNAGTSRVGAASNAGGGNGR